MFRLKSLIFSLLAVTCFMFSIPLAYGDVVPRLINYQGTLTDKLGAPVPAGNYSIQFSIYDVSTGGTALWTEKWDATTSQVTTANGIFNVVLGVYTSIPATFFAEHPVSYLGVKVGTDSEMLPRQRIVSVAYAFAAGNGVPKGGIIMWSGAVDKIPDGWALCNGSNGTPDLRDRFIVGAGGAYTKGQAGGEATHILTVAEMPAHTHVDSGHSHGVSDPGHRHVMITNGGTTSSGNFANVSGGNPDQYTGYATTGITINTGSSNIQNTGGGQSHNNLPPYYALAFIMKL